MLARYFLPALAAASTLAGVAAAVGQESRPALTRMSAEAIIDGCQAFAQENGLALSVAVFDAGGDLRAFERMDNAHLGSARISQWKGLTSASFRAATADVARWAERAPGLARGPEVSTLEGGVAIFTADGAHLGGVGVSGASAAQDANCARAGIAAAELHATRDG